MAIVLLTLSLRNNDIQGCSDGIFDTNGGKELHLLTVPRLCATFTRSTFFLDCGGFQPSLQGTCYSTEPTNHYAKAIHKYEVNHKGYACPYDDVHRDGAIDSSGLLPTDSPHSLRFLFADRRRY